MRLGKRRLKPEPAAEELWETHGSEFYLGRDQPTLELGTAPGILVVDLACGFTDPASPVGTDLTDAVRQTRRLLDAARAKRLPVIFTAIGFEANGKDAALWTKKSPSLAKLTIGSPWVVIDPRLDPRSDESIVVKKGASALFGTNVAAILVAQHVDTVILCGATTSGCVRATAVDLMQHGWPTVVPRECVADRAEGPHAANLFDIQAKYADVLSLDEVLRYLADLP